jgi:hypothetical protein
MSISSLNIIITKEADTDENAIYDYIVEKFGKSMQRNSVKN